MRPACRRYQTLSQVRQGLSASNSAVSVKIIRRSKAADWGSFPVPQPSVELKRWAYSYPAWTTRQGTSHAHKTTPLPSRRGQICPTRTAMSGQICPVRASSLPSKSFLLRESPWFCSVSRCRPCTPRRWHVPCGTVNRIDAHAWNGGPRDGFVGYE